MSGVFCEKTGPFLSRTLQNKQKLQGQEGKSNTLWSSQSLWVPLDATLGQYLEAGRESKGSLKGLAKGVPYGAAPLPLVSSADYILLELRT